jgi:hypothetical protein
MVFPRNFQQTTNIHVVVGASDSTDSFAGQLMSKCVRASRGRVWLSGCVVLVLAEIAPTDVFHSTWRASIHSVRKTSNRQRTAIRRGRFLWLPFRSRHYAENSCAVRLYIPIPHLHNYLWQVLLTFTLPFGNLLPLALLFFYVDTYSGCIPSRYSKTASYYVGLAKKNLLYTYRLSCIRL